MWYRSGRVSGRDRNANHGETVSIPDDQNYNLMLWNLRYFRQERIKSFGVKKKSKLRSNNSANTVLQKFLRNTQMAKKNREKESYEMKNEVNWVWSKHMLIWPQSPIAHASLLPQERWMWKNGRNSRVPFSMNAVLPHADPGTKDKPIWATLPLAENHEGVAVNMNVGAQWKTTFYGHASDWLHSATLL